MKRKLLKVLLTFGLAVSLSVGLLYVPEGSRLRSNGGVCKDRKPVHGISGSQRRKTADFRGSGR